MTCVAVLGGSFDPVHNGHVALAGYFVKLLAPDQLRIIPAGNPWQKGALRASAVHRVAMVRQAFAAQPVPVVIDEQEIRRTTPTYTIDTLRSLRAECGDRTSIAFLLGADQLQHLDTWRDWRQLFDHAHLCVASRPGFGIGPDHMPAEVAREFSRRAGTPEHIRGTPHGLTCFAASLAIDISATEIRSALADGRQPDSLIPPKVLDYIKLHDLYRGPLRA